MIAVDNDENWMIFRRSLLSALLTASITVSIAACSVTPDSADVFENRFPVGDAEEIFESGFRNISEKYIDDVMVETLAVEGIRGLSSLDPAISLSLGDQAIEVSYNRQTISHLLKPDADDSSGWATVVAATTADAQFYSNEIKTSDPERLYEAVFDGAISTLDVYSRYAGKAEAGENRAKRDGFGGIGVRFSKEQDRILITEVLPSSPAENSGIMVHDELIAIEDKAVSDMDMHSIVKMLRGPIGTSVDLVISRDSISSLSLTLKRSHIVPPTVKVKLLDDVMHMKITSFNQGTASSVVSELKNYLGPESETHHDIKGIVLDLRGNPGGLLKQSIEVADAFLVHGDILNTLGRHPDSIQHYEAAGQDQALGLPMAVLIDGKSASAAEIVAAALQDRERAVVVGTSSYGKGSVQTVVRLPNSGEITLTWSRFMAPSGYVLQDLGVFPVICTSGTETETDGFLRKALQNHGKTLGTLEVWRAMSHKDKAEFSELRNECPPERHNSKDDVEIARSLITDGALYFKALDLTSATAHVMN